MKTTLLSLITLLFLSQSFYSQKNKWYKTIEEGLTTPDSVYVLDLRNQNLNEIPIDVREFKNITALYLGGNNITTLPNWLFNLEKIEILSLGEITGEGEGYEGNPISILPDDIRKLVNLRQLNLSGCPIEILPEFLGDMEKLSFIGIANTKIKNIPNSIRAGNKKGESTVLGVDSKQLFNDETTTYLKIRKKLGYGKSYTKVSATKMLKYYI